VKKSRYAGEKIAFAGVVRATGFGALLRSSAPLALPLEVEREGVRKEAEPVREH
jgi:hypothetical protein